MGSKCFTRCGAILCAAGMTMMTMLLSGCGGQPSTADLLGHDPRFGQLSDKLVVTEIDETSKTATLPNDEDNWHVQKKPDYCWAACMQSVMSLQGSAEIPTQPELWEKFASNPMFKENRDAATFEEICFALAPEFQGQMPGYFVVDTEATYLSDMVRALASGEPVIVGLLSGGMFDATGHAYVLYAMDFRDSEDDGMSKRDIWEKGKGVKDGIGNFFSGKKQEEKSFEEKDNSNTAFHFHLFDPDEPVPEAPDYGGGMKEKPLDEIKDSFGFALSASIAREYLKNRMQWLQRHDQGPGIYVVNPLDRDGSPMSVKAVGDL